MSYYIYREPSLEDLHIGSEVNGRKDNRLATSCVANYAQARRTLLNITHNDDTVNSTAGVYNVDSDPIMKSILFSQNLIRPGVIKIWFYCATDTQDNAEDTVEIYAEYGSSSGITTVLSTTKAWYSISLTIDENDVSDFLNFKYVCIDDEGENELTVDSICIYQPEYSSSPTWVDLDATNQKLGDDDYPYSAFMIKTVRDAVVACHNSKAARANLYNHWYGANQKTGDYAADTRGLGCYKVVKRRGVSELKMHALACKSTGDANWTLGAYLGTYSDSVSVTSEDAMAWYTLTFTITDTDDIADELELELKIDGSETVDGTVQTLVGLYLCETSGSSTSHSVPSIGDYGTNTKVLSSQIENIRTTCQSLWNYGGRSIACSDWRTSDDGTGVHACQETSHDKTSYSANKNVIARALAFSSTGATRIKVTMVYAISGSANDGSEKQILAQLSESTTLENWIDVNPDTSDGYVRLYDDIDLTTGPINIFSCYLDIDSGDWETHYNGTDEPPQVWLTAIMESGSTTWIMPLLIHIEEVELGSGDV